LRWNSYTSDRRDRIFGFTGLNYQINKHFNISSRISLDQYSAIQEERLAKGSVPSQFGIGGPGVAGPTEPSGYARFNKNNRETSLDFMATYKRDLTADLNLNAFLGASFRRKYSNSVYASTNGGLVVDGLYSISNSVNTPLPAVEVEYLTGVNGYFADASIRF
jgi:hypothetical protein